MLILHLQISIEMRVSIGCFFEIVGVWSINFRIIGKNQETISSLDNVLTKYVALKQFDF